MDTKNESRIESNECKIDNLKQNNQVTSQLKVNKDKNEDKNEEHKYKNKEITGELSEESNKEQSSKEDEIRLIDDEETADKIDYEQTRSTNDEMHNQANSSTNQILKQINDNVNETPNNQRTVGGLDECQQQIVNDFQRFKLNDDESLRSFANESTDLYQCKLLICSLKVLFR